VTVLGEPLPTDARHPLGGGCFQFDRRGQAGSRYLVPSIGNAPKREAVRVNRENGSLEGNLGVGLSSSVGRLEAGGSCCWDGLGIETQPEDGMNNLLIPVGGVITGSGLMALIFGFESTTGGMVSTTFSDAGFTALDQWIINPTGKMGLLLIVTGMVMMIKGNSGLWKKTGGY
jgi:hypothetical protein